MMKMSGDGRPCFTKLCYPAITTISVDGRTPGNAVHKWFQTSGTF